MPLAFKLIAKDDFTVSYFIYVWCGWGSFELCSKLTPSTSVNAANRHNNLIGCDCLLVTFTPREL